MCNRSDPPQDSIFHADNIRKIQTRTPEEILKRIQEREQVNKHFLLQYWRNPPPEDRNCPMNYYKPDGWIRSGYLARYVSNTLTLPKDARIFEVGSGVGRNLAVLKFAGYDHLSGVELSQNSIDTMRAMMPILTQTNIRPGPAEDVLPSIMPLAFDLVFTMAVLEHLPPESETVFAEIVRITRKYVLTIEDEQCISFRHFPRNYKRVFEKLGLKQIDFEKKLVALPRSFRLRLFVKEGA